ncbi:hypothetical protein Tco_0750755 [Tanacetum coccineum]|uniref:Integrase, catalytic region, zinc finger, CCHC-type, peptidase aspartic, catalytic n=1 Tax=Tanacetum coccineum TaxID=301880 RepID=A0ABQ4Z244_9ASTR
MATLAEFMIISNADNRPPMLEKSLYDSWESRMELYIDNRENRRMILSLLLNGPLVWPTVVEEDGTTRTKKYEEIFVAEKLQADCDLKATNIVLQGLPPDVYAIVNHHKVAKEIWDKVKLLMQGTKLSLQEKECQLYDEYDKFSFVKGEHCISLVVPVFNQGDDPIADLNKAIDFLIMAGLLRNKFKGGKNKVMMVIAMLAEAMLAEAQVAGQILDEEQLAFLTDSGILDGQAAQTTIPNTAAFQTKDLDAYDSDCDDVSNAKAVLMANLSNYGSDILRAQRIKPTLYDGSVISSQHVVILVIDDEETLILEEKDQFDSIKKTRALSKEHCDSLIAQLNSKSLENADLKGHIQEKVFVTTALQSELRRLKGKHVLDNATTITNATTIAPRMFKLDIKPLSHRLKNNRDAYEDYLKKTTENTDTIRGLIERARK